MTKSYFESDLANNPQVSDAELDQIHDIKNVVWDEHHNRSVMMALCCYIGWLASMLPESEHSKHEENIKKIVLVEAPSNQQISNIKTTCHTILNDYQSTVYNINQPDVFELSVNQIGAYKLLDNEWRIYCKEPSLFELMQLVDIHACTIREDGTLAFNYLKLKNGEELTFKRHSFPYLNGLTIAEFSLELAFPFIKELSATLETT